MVEVYQESLVHQGHYCHGGLGMRHSINNYVINYITFYYMYWPTHTKCWINPVINFLKHVYALENLREKSTVYL